MYRVLVPVDRDENRALHQASYVAGLSAEAEVAATVLYVVPPERFTRAEAVSFGDVDAAVSAADRLAEEGVTVDRVVGDGGVAGEIIRTADDLGADEIVMAGRKRSGVAEVLLGSTTTDVLVSTDRPVTVTDDSAGPTTDRVLVPVDRDRERALDQAAYVAGLPGAADLSATVFYVFPD
jgi:nucleotide-binding universal stress UspA family protein